MVDLEVVRRRLREIDRRLGGLEEIRAKGDMVFQREYGLQTQAERHMQLAIQAAIDVAVHIVAEDSALTPEDYGSSFLMLAQMGILEESLAERLRSAAGLRNILVHAYLEVDPRMMWASMEHLEDLRSFASAIQTHLAEKD